MIRGLDHISIAVRDLDAAIPLWERAIGATVVHRELVPEQKVEVVMLSIGSLQIELVAPTDETSPVARFLSSRGEGLHHIALQCDATQSELNRLKAAGAELIDATARSGAGQSHVGFVHPRALGGVLLEFVDHSDKSGE